MKTREIRLRDGRTGRVRPLEPSDAESALTYIDCVTAETDYLGLEHGELDWPVEKERQSIEDHCKADNKLILAAEVDGRIVGLLGFTGDDKKKMRHTGELGLSVRQPYWRLGLGSFLMVGALEWAKASGVVRKIGLRVRTDNEPAVRLYQRFGFVTEGTVRRQFLVAGTFRDAYLMGLEIDPPSVSGTVTSQADIQEVIP
jgi:RimJ/RimL family protein N-acetyltransferase